MRLFIPCDYKKVDLLTEPDANLFGEALREYCFIGNCEQRGCYSTFNVLEYLIQVKSGKIFKEAKKELYEDIEARVYHYKLEEKDCYIKYHENDKIISMKVSEPMEIVCAWAWDGDGCLYFRFNDRKVINTDCKKDYTWKWIE